MRSFKVPREEKFVPVPGIKFGLPSYPANAVATVLIELYHVTISNTLQAVRVVTRSERFLMQINDHVLCMRSLYFVSDCTASIFQTANVYQVNFALGCK